MNPLTSFINWIMNASMDAKLILAIGLGGVFIIWQKHKQHEEEAKKIKTKEIPSWRRKYM